uniref:Uncharacterized protein n=1 Tax=Rhizophora mucronata TaxID=61149 RepID=A0A2P2N0P8_RHIMU
MRTRVNATAPKGQPPFGFQENARKNKNQELHSWKNYII